MTSFVRPHLEIPNFPLLKGLFFNADRTLRIKAIYSSHLELSLILILMLLILDYIFTVLYQIHLKRVNKVFSVQVESLLDVQMVERVGTSNRCLELDMDGWTLYSNDMHVCLTSSVWPGVKCFNTF